MATGLHKKPRKGLNIATRFGYYELEPVLADQWESLTLPEFETLQPGEKVYVLQRCGTVNECVFKRLGSGLPHVPGREAVYRTPGKPHELGSSQLELFL